MFVVEILVRLGCIVMYDAAINRDTPISDMSSLTEDNKTDFKAQLITCKFPKQSSEHRMGYNVGWF